MKSNIIAEIRQDFSIFWFRRDLRLEDNTGLNEALSGPYPVLPVFLFDPDILDKLHGPTDKRLDFIHARLQLLKIQSGLTLCDEMATRIWDLKISQTYARSRFCTGKMPEIL